MIFKEWLSLNENIVDNFDLWLTSIVKYAKPNEKEILNSLSLLPDPEGDIVYDFNHVLSTQKFIIIRVLGEKHLENINWLSFCIGYLQAKTFQKEDLELAIDVTKRRIDNRELPKSEIGQKGWMKIGEEAQLYVVEYLRSQQELSNRQKLKLKKSGDTLKEDENLIRLVADENNLKLYYLPKVIDKSDDTEQNYNQLQTNKSQTEGRKRILCKYGKGTDWCTASPSGEYDQYYAHNDIYIVHENDVPKYQFTSCVTDNPQFMDVKDNHVADIELKVKELLEKHISNASRCYEFKIIFPDLESYRNNKDRKVSAKNMNLLKTDEFKKLSPQEAKEFLQKINIGNLSASDSVDLIRSLPDGVADYFDDKTISGLLLRLQWHSAQNYDELAGKFSSDRLQKFLNNYKNDNLEDYAQGMQDSRKKTIRELLVNSHSLDNSFRILKFLTKQISLGSQEVYTIVDTIISIISKNYSDSLLNKRDIADQLDNLATHLGKSNVNQIDLNKLQERMKIELIPENGKYKITMPERDYKSARYLMSLFLKDHSDKII